jgi:prophage regulatory protein
MYRLLDGAAVDERRARRRTQRYDDVADGLLPAPIKLGRMSRWPEHEIDAVIAAEIRGDTPDQIRSLVRDLVAARSAAA